MSSRTATKTIIFFDTVSNLVWENPRLNGTKSFVPIIFHVHRGEQNYLENPILKCRVAAGQETFQSFQELFFSRE